MPVAPRLRPGVSLHYKTRIKLLSNISFLLSLLHNSYVFKVKKKTSNKHKLDCTATYGRWRLELEFRLSYKKNHDLCSENKCLVSSQLICMDIVVQAEADLAPRL